MIFDRAACIGWCAWAFVVLGAARSTLALAADLPSPMGIIIGRLAQSGFVLGALALIVAVIAVARVWRGDRGGQRLCLLVSAPIELGNLLLVVLPGFERTPRVIIEPAVWLLAVTLTLVALTRPR